MNERKREFVGKIKSGQGTVEEEEAWLSQVKEIAPYFYDSDAMLYLESSVQSRREYERLRAQMGPTLDRAQLVDLVRKICQAKGSEIEMQAWLMLVERNVPHPAVSDLIFYPDVEMTALEIVEVALSYKPILL